MTAPHRRPTAMPLGLLQAAEQLIRAHPIEDLPPGTSRLVTDLCDLIGRFTP